MLTHVKSPQHGHVALLRGCTPTGGEVAAAAQGMVGAAKLPTPAGLFVPIPGGKGA